MKTQEILNISGLYKSFGEKQVLKGINLNIQEGEVVTLTGGNGTGKTTIFNIITGFVRPDEGTILYRGENITRKAPYRINQIGIARTFQDLRIITQMTVRENILLALEKKMFHFPNSEERKNVAKIIEQVSLESVASKLANEISPGQQKLLTLGCCIASNPNLFLLDEPVAGIDSANVERIKSIVLGLKKEGKTVLQIEHDIGFSNSTSDRIINLTNGEAINI